MTTLSRKRLVAIDLDGTLLDHQNRLSRKNIETIKKALKLGIEFVPVSARPPFGIDFALQKLDAYRFLVAYNGSYVYDRESDHVLFNQLITPEDAEAILRLVEKHKLYTGVYLGNRYFALIDNKCAQLEARFQGKPPTIVPNLLPLVEQGANKIIVIDLDSPHRLAMFYEEVRTKIKGVNILPSSSVSLEIVHQDTTKGGGLRMVAETLRLKPSEIVAIGDNYNDLSMLEYAGLSVAVGNAPVEVRDRADLVVAACEEDGVSEALERIFLNQAASKGIGY